MTMHEELERIASDQEQKIRVSPSNLLHLGGALMSTGGLIIAFPNFVGAGLIVAGLAAVAYLFTSWKKGYALGAEDNSDYEMPDELREMPEFAPIGGYRRISKEPVQKTVGPKLTIVEELGLDRFR
jgi:hypothetical protein